MVPTQGGGTLVELFNEGMSAVQASRYDNLFKDLDERALTADEEDIIAKRVALQRKMLEEYEKRDRKRKVLEILDLCPDLTEEEAEEALKQHGYREEDTAAALTESVNFKRRIKAQCGNPEAGQAVHVTTTVTTNTRSHAKRAGFVGPTANQLKAVRKGSVFVGTFRGKGWERYASRPRVNENTDTSGRALRSSPRARPPSASIRGPEPAMALAASPPQAVARGPRTGHRRPTSSPGTRVPQTEPGVEELPEALVQAGREERAKRRAAGLPAASPVASPGNVRGSRRKPEAGEGSLSALSSPEHGAQLSIPPGAKTGRARRLSLPDTPILRSDQPQEDVPLESPAQQGSAALEDDALAADEQNCPQNTIRRAVFENAVFVRSAPGHYTLRALVLEPGIAQDVAQAATARQQPALAAKPKAEKSKPPVIADAEVHISDSDATESDDAFCAPKGRRRAPARRQKPPAGRKAPSALPVSPGDNALGRTRGEARRLSVGEPQLPASPLTESEAEQGRAAAGEAKRSRSPMSDDGGPGKRLRRMSWRGAAALEAVASEDEGMARQSRRRPGNSSPVLSPAKRRKGAGATRSSPRQQTLTVPAQKPRLGRVKRCSSKVVDLIELGRLCTRPGWHNNGYIFPDGFVVRTVFRSSVELDQLCAHECRIFSGGSFSPGPTFRIVASDLPDEPLDAKSATGAWNAVLERINSEIRRRRALGEDIPPPPKTAIAGPEYFGLTHPAIVEQLESLDPDRTCTAYWAGKQDRIAYGTFHGIDPDRKGPSGYKVVPAGASSAPTAGRPAPLGPRRVKRRRSDEDGAVGEDDDEEVGYTANRWSGVNRTERYKRRHGGEDSGLDADNPLPGVIDPVTLEPIANPAMSPYGHVMGLATWRAVLAEQGKCPFTQQPLRPEQITVLTKSNIERLRDRLILHT